MANLERITITIKPELLKKIDKMIDKNSIRNRSHAVEYLMLKSIQKTDLNTAVIMAGGDAASLGPIKHEISKPLIPIHGKPVLYYQIKLLRKYGIDNIFLCVGKKHDKIKEYFGNGEKFGINIEYIIEDNPLGTAGPLRLVRDSIKNTFLFLNVDTLMNPDISEALEFNKKQQNEATVFLITVDDPTHYGVARLRGNNILEFVEKPSKDKEP